MKTLKGLDFADEVKMKRPLTFQRSSWLLLHDHFLQMAHGSGVLDVDWKRVIIHIKNPTEECNRLHSFAVLSMLPQASPTVFAVISNDLAKGTKTPYYFCN